MNPWLILGVVGGAVVVGVKLFQAQRLSAKSVVRTLNPRIHKADLQGLALRMEIVVDNPTNASLRVSKPVVTLMTGGRFVASSPPSNQTYEIRPLASTQMDTIEIVIPWMALTGYLTSIAMRIPQLVAQHRATGQLSFQALAVPLEYRYSLYVGDFYYESPIERLV
jgi:hypothetical protein